MKHIKEEKEAPATSEYSNEGIIFGAAEEETKGK